jgi:KDO2-lipid IV(A) lauroyltransferase
MLLITLTTGAGFGSLGASRVPGLQNAGGLVAVGVVACLAATLVVLPALEALFRRTGLADESSGIATPSAAAPPHAPETGTMRRILGPFHVTGVFWFRLHGSGIGKLPDWAVGPVIGTCVCFFTVALRKIRRGVAANLDVVLGPCGFWRREARLFATFHEFAWCLSERYERLTTDRPFEASVEGLEHWREACAAETGFILVTAHIGAWEGGSMLPAVHEGRRVHVVREAETDPRAQRFIAELIQKRSGPHYTTHFLDDQQLGIELMDALRRGEIVALQGDRPRQGGRVVQVQLFGKPFPLPIGPAALARAAAVPIVPVFVFRDGRRRYLCSIREPIRVARSGDREDDTRRALQSFAVELERAIRFRPHQWFCFRRAWPE